MHNGYSCVVKMVKIACPRKLNTLTRNSECMILLLWHFCYSHITYSIIEKLGGSVYKARLPYISLSYLLF